jgi:hypothetical protein
LIYRPGPITPICVRRGALAAVCDGADEFGPGKHRPEDNVLVLNPTK